MKEVCEGSNNGCMAAHKLHVVRCKAQEGAELFDIGWLRPVLDCFDLMCIHADAICADSVAQEVPLQAERKEHLLSFGIQFVLAQNLQDLPQVLLMFSRTFAEHQNVIQVDNYALVPGGDGRHHS